MVVQWGVLGTGYWTVFKCHLKPVCFFIEGGLIYYVSHPSRSSFRHLVTLPLDVPGMAYCVLANGRNFEEMIRSVDAKYDSSNNKNNHFRQERILPFLPSWFSENMGVSQKVVMLNDSYIPLQWLWEKESSPPPSDKIRHVWNVFFWLTLSKTIIPRRPPEMMRISLFQPTNFTATSVLTTDWGESDPTTWFKVFLAIKSAWEFMNQRWKQVTNNIWPCMNQRINHLWIASRIVRLFRYMLHVHDSAKMIDGMMRTRDAGGITSAI